ncbi:hypothetical protein WG66_010821 [Moniliophthora roreri]|nr:hypothetical protein WG66_010821 [Moniliophthora roreri]
MRTTILGFRSFLRLFEDQDSIRDTLPKLTDAQNPGDDPFINQFPGVFQTAVSSLLTNSRLRQTWTRSRHLIEDSDSVTEHPCEFSVKYPRKRWWWTIDGAEMASESEDAG